tara:strand:+ start:337 stop:660 length:324 start_codon:yes stop_codon:yes gene_type:complete
MAKKKFTKAQEKTVNELWEYTKQANMQTDNIEMEGFSQGITYGPDTDSWDTGSSTGTSWSFGELDDVQLDLFSEEDMREKYPALKQAYEHYQSVLEVCKTKEKEDAN